MQKRKINICQNHLTQFYEALKYNDLNLSENIEHLLSPQEKCVACVYLLSAQGTIKEALVDYFAKEGILVDPSPSPKTVKEALVFWSLRALFFIMIFFIIVTAESFVKKLLFGIYNDLFSLGLVELVAVSMVSLFIFLIVDDICFD